MNNIDNKEINPFEEHANYWKKADKSNIEK